MAYLATAGLHDPRVGYWEPAKLVAKLRRHKVDDNLLLFKCEMGAGHFRYGTAWGDVRITVLRAQREWAI